MGYCLPYRNGSAGCAPWLSTGTLERSSGASQNEEGAVDLDIHISYTDPLAMTNRNPFIFAPFHNDGGPSRGCVAEGDPGVKSGAGSEGVRVAFPFPCEPTPSSAGPVAPSQPGRVFSGAADQRTRRITTSYSPNV